MSNVSISITIDSQQAQAELQKLSASFENLMKLAQRFNFGSGVDTMIKEAQKLQQTLQGMDKELRQVSKTTQEINRTAKEGFSALGREIEETQKKVVSLKWSFKDILKDAISLANFQMRWYAARNVIFAVPRSIGEGISFEAEIDKAQAQLLRYSAMEGNVTNFHKQAVDELTTYSRQLAINMPIAFEEIIKSADRLLAAGADLDTVKGSLQSFAKLQVAFPEIEMEKFTTAIIGFLNTFRKSPGLMELENDTQRLQAILDKVTVALAKGVIAPKDIGLVIQHLGQMSQAAGFSIDQMLALSVMVTNLGAKAGPASRALRGLIDSLSTTKGIENLQLIGVHLDKSKTIAEQFKTIIEGLRGAVGTGENGLTLGSMEFLRGIAPTERRGALIALIRELERYDELVNSISQSHGALDRTADVMTNTLSGQWQIFKNLTKEIGAALTQSELLKDGLGLLIGTFKLLGFMLSGVVGLLSLVVDGLKFLYHTLRLVTNPIERLVVSIGYLLLGDFKSALAEIKRMPQVFDEHLFKANDALTGSLDRAAKEVQTIQDVLFGKSQFSGGKGEIKSAGMAGYGVPEDTKTTQQAYKNMLKDAKEYEQFLKNIYDIEKKISDVKTNDALKAAQADATKQSINLENQYKLGEISIEDYYKQKDLFRQEDIAKEAASIQEQTMQLKAEIEKRVEHIRQSMKNLNTEDALRATREIFRLYKDQELLDAQETAKINELIRKGDVERTKESLQLAFERWQAEKNYKEQLMKLTYDATTMELFGIENTKREAEKKFSSLLPLIEQLADKMKQAWMSNVDIDILKTQKNIYDVKGNKVLSMATQADIYAKELDKIGAQIKQRESDLMIARVTSKDVEFVQRDLDRLKMQYELTATQMHEIQQKLIGSPLEGFVAGLNKYSNEAGTIYMRMEQAGLQIARSMENAFMNFFDYTSEGFMKFGKLAISILNEIYKEILRIMIIKPLVAAITKGIRLYLFGDSSATKEHSGGYIMHTGGYIPRFHFGGLAHDEVPAILQRGEYVVSRRGVAALDAINQGNIIGQPEVNVVLNVQNNTGLPVQATEGGFRFNGKQMVKEIILELKRTDPSFNYEMAWRY
jgi:TP901 family phage tail tape measure protein